MTLTLIIPTQSQLIAHPPLPINHQWNCSTNPISPICFLILFPYNDLFCRLVRWYSIGATLEVVFSSINCVMHDLRLMHPKSSFTVAMMEAESNNKHCHISFENSVVIPILSPSITLSLKQSLTLVGAWKSIVYQPQMTDLHTRAVWADQALLETGNAVSQPFLCLLQPAQSAFLPVALDNVSHVD